jgi:general secretion pathway protein D
MIVTPKITTRTNETLEITTGVFAEAFATRSATTKVAIMDGQTIVIGGLIEDQIKDIVSKVPLLGDLPLLGGLFRHKSTSTTKTELLIFLTPTVARDALALTPISDKVRSLSNIQNDETVREIYQSHMKALEDPNEQADAIKK